MVFPRLQIIVHPGHAARIAWDKVWGIQRVDFSALDPIAEKFQIVDEGFIARTMTCTDLYGLPGRGGLLRRKYDGDCILDFQTLILDISSSLLGMKYRLQCPRPFTDMASVFGTRGAYTPLEQEEKHNDCIV